MTTAVITTAHGRHDHLRLQLRGFAQAIARPADHVVVAMNDRAIASVIAETGCEATVLAHNVDDDRLRVGAARNAGADAALRRGAELLVFLDVDCVPAPEMLVGYQHAASHPACRDAVMCGPVSYLPPPPAAGYDTRNLAHLADPHPARPAPVPGELIRSTDHRLFWSLSFAVTASTWRRIGGFCTDYCGYGCEDTDFGQLAAAAGIGLWWVGGADAFHQYHPVSDPPVEHLRDIVANARLFQQRWGWWPMEGWLRAFADRGLIRWDRRGLALA